MSSNTPDRNDAIVLAQILRPVWFLQVHVNSNLCHLTRALLTSRGLLVGMRGDIDNQIRGLLKTFGIVFGKAVGGFRKRAAEIVSGELAESPELARLMEAVAAVHVAPAARAYVLDRVGASRTHPAVRVGASPLSFVAGLLLVLLFAHALSWAFALVGLSAPDSETAQLAAFPVLFPFTFASSAFVPVDTMPGWLQAFTVHQPVSQVVDASRQLMLGPSPTGLWSTGNVWQALAWTAGMLVVFVPLAVRRYRRAS